MTTFLTVLHVLVCVFMIIVILLQRGRGAEIGAVFGGGASSTVFGSRGAGNFLTKLTTASAILFMVTSLALSYLVTSRGSERLFEEDVPAEAAAAERPGFEEVGTVPAETGAEAAGAGTADAAGVPPGAAAAPEPAPR
jgi:preprotein translocase subunit SecG